MRPFCGNRFQFVFWMSVSTTAVLLSTAISVLASEPFPSPSVSPSPSLRSTLNESTREKPQRDGQLSYGGYSGGGGDSIAFEFAAYGQAWDRIISDLSAEELTGIDPEKFHESVYRSFLRTQEQASFDGEVDAFNEGNRIVINRTRWSQNSRKQKLGIALHEFLGLMNLDRNYEISIPLTKKYETEALANLGMRSAFKCTINVYEGGVVNGKWERKLVHSDTMIRERLNSDNPGWGYSYSVPLQVRPGVSLAASFAKSRAQISLSHGYQTFVKDENGNLIPVGQALPARFANSSYESPTGDELPSNFKLKTSLNVTDRNQTASATVDGELLCVE